LACTMATALSSVLRQVDLPNLGLLLLLVLLVRWGEMFSAPSWPEPPPPPDRPVVLGARAPPARRDTPSLRQRPPPPPPAMGTIEESEAVSGGGACQLGLCPGFQPPVGDDVPGNGDIANVQLAHVEQCASMCLANPKCRGFEWSGTAKSEDATRSCQLVSSTDSRAGMAYRDFRLYVRGGDTAVKAPEEEASGAGGGGGADCLTQVQIEEAAEKAMGEMSKYCDVLQVEIKVEDRHAAKANEIRASLAGRDKPTYAQLYQLILGKTFQENDNIWSTLRNPFQVEADTSPSKLTAAQVDKSFQLLGHTPEFAVELGSGRGSATLVLAEQLDAAGARGCPVVCVDTWTSGLDDMLGPRTEAKLLLDGHSSAYWQFMVGMQKAMLKETISSKHVIPMAATTAVGARWMMAAGVRPDLIFVNPGRGADETSLELALWYSVLSPGGVLFGAELAESDASFDRDIRHFAAKRELDLLDLGAGAWGVKKPAA